MDHADFIKSVLTRAYSEQLRREGKRDDLRYVYDGMKQRCHNPNSRAYKWYGARGITVCPEWLNSFETFVRDMGPRPSGLTLERKDNNKGYSSGNCIWATWEEQRNNQRGRS